MVKYVIQILGLDLNRDASITVHLLRIGCFELYMRSQARECRIKQQFD